MSFPFFNPATSPSTILILVDVPLAIALPQHGIPFLPPLKSFISMQFQAPAEISPNAQLVNI